MAVANEDTILKNLAEVIGSDYVSSDPAILVCYSRDQSPKPAMNPTYVVLPGSREEVQKVIKIANEFKIPVIPRSTGVNVAGFCVPSNGGILVDLKRMDRIIEIDERNMTAIIEPGVLMAQLQAEAYKRGLKIIVPSAPGSVSVMANYIATRGTSIASVKFGVGDNHIVGLEWILPNGEILELGSVVYPNGWQTGCVGHGPGPDLLGLFLEAGGGLGICTKAKVKLYPKPEVRKSYIVMYNERGQLMEAMSRVQKSGIASHGYVHLPSTYAAHFFTLSNEAAENVMKLLPPYSLLAFIEGTQRQVEYEEKVFNKIIEETQGAILDLSEIASLFGGADIGLDPKPPETGIVHQADYMTITVRIMRPKGAFGITVFIHNIEDSFNLYDKFEEICESKGYEDLTTYYIQPMDDYHYAFIEMDIVYDHGQAGDRELAEKIFREVNSALTNEGEGLNYYEPVSGPTSKLIGPKLGKYYQLLNKFKETLDPNSVMNPGVYLPK
ncbi:MAG: FAD-binding oxidoreductase [Candidatus Lokiarchaeia archaeon]